MLIRIQEIAARTPPITGQQAVTTSAVALPTTTDIIQVVIKANRANAAPVYIGPAGVTTVTGFELGAGDAIQLTTENMGLLYVIAAAGGNSISWIGKRI